MSPGKIFLDSRFDFFEIISYLLYQVTEALLYLRDQDLVHGSVSSHSVQMVTRHTAKLAMLERTVLEGEDVRCPPASLYNWSPPEILIAVAQSATTFANRENDIFRNLVKFTPNYNPGANILLYSEIQNIYPRPELSQVSPGKKFFTSGFSIIYDP